MAAYAVRADAEAPLNALIVGDIEPPDVPSGWVPVQVKAAALNHHDIWSLRGVGLPADRLPMILGCDAAGVTGDGREVIVHAVINAPDFVGSDATYDPARSLLSERYPGTFATQVRVPRANLVLGQLRARNLPIPAAIFAERLARALEAMREPRAAAGAR